MTGSRETLFKGKGVGEHIFMRTFHIHTHFVYILQEETKQWMYMYRLIGGLGVDWVFEWWTCLTMAFFLFPYRFCSGDPPR